MRKILEFVFSLPLVALFWFWLFPMLGATTADSPVLLCYIIVGYTVATVYAFQFFYGAELLIGARYNETLVFGCLLASQLLIPFGAAALAGLLIAGLVISYAKLAIAVSIGFVCQYALLVLIGPLRKRIDNYEWMRHVTLLVWTHGAYIPVIRNGKLVDGELLIIEPENLLSVEHALTIAWNIGIVDGNWEEADYLMVKTIPRLSGCNYLGILRLQAAIQVLAQSYQAAGNQAKAAEMQQRHGAISRIYREHGAF